MVFKNSIRDSIRENGGLKKRKEDRPKRNYDRFFEGYTETLSSGNKVKYIYTGVWYCPNLSGWEYFINRLMYLVLYVCIWFLLIRTAAVPGPVNCTWYVGIAQSFCIFFLGWLAVALIYCFIGGRRMKVYIYKSMTKHFRLSLNGLMGAFALLAVTNILWIILHIKEMEMSVATGVLAYTVCLIATVFIRHNEKALQYISQ